MTYSSYLEWEKSKRGLDWMYLWNVFDIVVLDLLTYLKLDTLFLFQSKLLKNYTKYIEDYSAVNIEEWMNLCKSVYFLEEYLDKVPYSGEPLLERIMTLQYHTNKCFCNLIIDLIQKMALPFYTKENE